MLQEEGEDFSWSIKASEQKGDLQNFRSYVLSDSQAQRILLSQVTSKILRNI